jgi:hypothetical protein
VTEVHLDDILDTHPGAYPCGGMSYNQRRFGLKATLLVNLVRRREAGLYNLQRWLRVAKKDSTVSKHMMRQIRNISARTHKNYEPTTVSLELREESR